MFSRPIALLILPLFSACSLCQMAPEQTREIIRRSAQATQADWTAPRGLTSVVGYDENRLPNFGGLDD